MKREQFKQLALQLNFRDLVDKYADPNIENLPSLDDYLGEWEDSGFDDEFLNPEMLKQDIIEYAETL
jgi:hypothetical protein|tara:strand:- start:24 stop:224 length:201 start_codon:yes stop_codon:yes gene_type:complete